MTLSLPSVWNIVISTIVFFLAAWYAHRLLNAQGVPKGMTRGLVVFVLAYLVSWGVGALVDSVVGPQPQVAVPQDARQLLDELGRGQR